MIIEGVRPFKLSDQFLEDYKGKQPEWGYNGLGYVVYKRTYARAKDDNTLEEYWETCRRVVEGTYTIQKNHCKALSLVWDDRKAQKSAQEMYRRMWLFKWLPPGRGLWMMGTPTIDKIGSAALQNCGYVSTQDLAVDFAGPFAWMMDMLMLGVGVGFDTKGAGTVTIVKPSVGDKPLVVADSREGWVEALVAVLNPFVGKGKLPAHVDYSQVRPYGSPIKGFGGTASGPEPLMDLIDKSSQILGKLEGQKITESAIVDIGNLVGRCVVAGNVRRSAEIAFGDPNSEEFLTLKDPELHPEELRSHRWASNNSIFATIGMDYSRVGELIGKNGEPGTIWLENIRKYSRMIDPPDWKDRKAMGTNPCVEQSLEDSETCNLVENFPNRHDSWEDFKATLKCSYLYAKTVTLLPTHNARTNMVLMRNRRIGCSMSGIIPAMQKFGRRHFLEQFCDEGYRYIQALDEKYSDWLCVRESIKTTSVKPSGTVSLLAGVSPGIHYPHSEYYIRRMRLQEGSPLVSFLQDAGYWVEKDEYSPNTMVAEFPIHEEGFNRSKSQVTMWEQLEMAAQMQHYWADNQVSVTITFNKDEAKDIKYALEMYESRLKGVSFLPLSEHGYAQAPYEEITKEEYEAKVALLKPITALESGAHEKTEKFCDSDKCEI